eukprot:NODE_9001_length_359_cov_0.733553.p3 GENE.NODE_9001_length_359_cov_0.733553~~NODE_9001_length_359_cov_0.733553.p3  ORF type:complete len:66 (-),score=3.94 NODE_9001_length_359_cov_0.733553:113-310(-)
MGKPHVMDPADEHQPRSPRDVRPTHLRLHAREHQAMRVHAGLAHRLVLPRVARSLRVCGSHASVA